MKIFLIAEGIAFIRSLHDIRTGISAFIENLLYSVDNFFRKSWSIPRQIQSYRLRVVASYCEACFVIAYLETVRADCTNKLWDT